MATRISSYHISGSPGPLGQFPDYRHRVSAGISYWGHIDHSHRPVVAYVPQHLPDEQGAGIPGSHHQDPFYWFVLESHPFKSSWRMRRPAAPRRSD